MLKLKRSGYAGPAVIAHLLLMAACGRTAPPAPQLHRLGEQVTVGPLIYSILDAEWKTQLGEGLEARAPKNRFLILQLTVTNSSSNESAIPPVTLEDERGNSHPEVMEGLGVANWLGMLRKIGAAQTAQGRVIFDVPASAYRIRVTDDTAEPGKEKAALIELPLRLEPEAPATLPPQR